MSKTLGLATILALTSLLAFVMVNHHAKPTNTFSEHKKTYGLVFDSVFEEKYRERVFAENVARLRLTTPKTATTKWELINSPTSPKRSSSRPTLEPLTKLNPLSLMRNQ